MRKYGKIDNNHNEIRQAFETIGFTVYSTSSLGGGYPDLSIYKRGKMALVEVKSGKAKLTEAEKEFFHDWKDVTYSVRSIDDVINISKMW